MIYSTRRVIYIIICNNDFLYGVVDTGKCRKLSVVGLFFSNTVGDLDQINLAALNGSEIDLPAFVVVYRNIISHIDQFIQDDVLKIVRKIIPVPGYANAVE